MTVYMGLDVSLTKTGVAFVNSQGKFQTWIIETNAAMQLPNRLADIYQSLYQLMAMQELPSMAVVERGFSGGAGPAAWLLGAANGVAMTACQQQLVEVQLVPPKVRAKLATGKGQADKPTVLIAARDRLGYRGTSYDEADAMWLAVAAFYIDSKCDLPWKLPQSHWDVLAPYIGEPE